MTRRPGTPALSADTEIPDRAWFKIGEVALLVGVEAHVLRFWEQAFPRDLRPERSAGNQRIYRRRDVETFRRIKGLRYEEHLDVRGARKRLRSDAGGAIGGRGLQLVGALRKELEELLRIIDEDEDGA